MAEPIAFYFDPLCPWCFMTSKWIRRLEELGEVDITWGIFSLEISNTKKDTLEDSAEFRGARALRTAELVGRTDGNAAMGRFYKAIGSRVWDEVEDGNDPDVVRGALVDSGVSADRHDLAMADGSTWANVVAGHYDLVNSTRSFGVPTVRLDAGAGPALFGPVISHEPATDAEAVELWQATLFLTRYDNFSELKRDRLEQPDLERIRRRPPR